MTDLVQPNEGNEGPKGYLFAEFDVLDADRFYTEYMPRVKPVLQAFGARFLVATDAPDIQEGDRAYGRMILLEFDSPELAKQFYHSKEYQDVINYRLESSKGALYILDGVTPA